jgi:serine/threonine-protein kinase
MPARAVVRRVVVFAVAAVCGLAARDGSAQVASAANQAAAEALFDQGKAAMAARNYAVACPKFFESNRLDEGLGTSLWLADCYEKNGQTASAWAEFREAAALAVKTSDSREKVARKRAQALEGRLAHLVVAVPATARLPGLHIARDGGEVAAPLWGASVPVDPGPHTLVVSAPDHRPETLTVDVRPGPGEQTVEVPLLTEAPVAAPVVAATPPEETAPPVTTAPPAAAPGVPVQRFIAVGAGAAGVVGVALAAYFGFAAKADLDDSNGAGHCNANNVCNSTGVNDRSSAESAATVSTALFIAGGAAIVGGVVLWLTAPRASATKSASAPAAALSVAPWLDPRSLERAGGVVLREEF